MTKAQLMDLIGQKPSAFSNINRGRNAIGIIDALQLADVLGCKVEELVQLNDEARRLVAKHRAETRLKEDQIRAKKDREKIKTWLETMSVFPLPLSAPDTWEALAEAASATNMRIELHIPSSREAGLEAAPLIDGMDKCLRNAGTMWRSNRKFAGAKSIEDYALELAGEAGLHVLWGRYVERTHPEDERDFIWLRKVLVVKISRHRSEPDFTIDRSKEPREESFPEQGSNEDSDHGLGDFLTWCSNRPFWEEVS
jgi:hypothetical protein